jgi:hypothetical protein
MVSKDFLLCHDQSGEPHNKRLLLARFESVVRSDRLAAPAHESPS